MSRVAKPDIAPLRCRTEVFNGYNGLAVYLSWSRVSLAGFGVALCILAAPIAHSKLRRLVQYAS
ncbi:MAG: hypothetical protein M0Q95_09680 [Porticoccaceae bacterium]|nr:hypothetical protein [Porticoccaceae bacterium]